MPENQPGLSFRDNAAPIRPRISPRRVFLRCAAAGAVVTALDGLYRLLAEEDEETRAVRAQVLDDGRRRLPPGQRLVQRLRAMGGDEGDPSPARFRLKVHGEVERPLELSYARLLALPQTEQVSDIHCVTGWSLLGGNWSGVQVRKLAEMARVWDGARHVIFEAACGYTTNVPIEEAMLPTVLVAHHLNGEPLPLPNGPPVRAFVPELYFWKSAKWLTGIRFVGDDEPGFWETRGYHNHGDPWKEERYA